MNGPFVVAQANVAGAAAAVKKPVRIVKVTKPSDGQAITVDLGYEQQTKLDLTAVANEKMTLVHIGEKLIILFDNNATVTVEPFFDSMGVPRQDLTVEVPGRDMSSSEFAAVFPITTDQSVLPAAGDKHPGFRRQLQQRIGRSAVEPRSAAVAYRRKSCRIGRFISKPFHCRKWCFRLWKRVSRRRTACRASPRTRRWYSSTMTRSAAFLAARGMTRISINANGTLAHDFGPDGAGTVLLLGTGNLPVMPPGLEFSFNPISGTQLQILQNGIHVLTITVTDPTTGAYLVQLYPASRRFRRCGSMTKI